MDLLLLGCVLELRHVGVTYASRICQRISTEKPLLNIRHERLSCNMFILCIPPDLEPNARVFQILHVDSEDRVGWLITFNICASCRLHRLFRV